MDIPQMSDEESKLSITPADISQLPQPPTPVVTLRTPDPGEAYPRDLATAVWKYVNEARISLPMASFPRSKSQLLKIFSIAYQASLRAEEGRPVRFTLVFDRSEKVTTMRFGSPLPFSVSEIVKLAPVIGLGLRTLVVHPVRTDQEKLQIIGLRDAQMSPRSGLSYPNRWMEGPDNSTPDMPLQVAAYSAGALRVSLRRGSTFDLKDGTIHFPLDLNSSSTIRMWWYVDSVDSFMSDTHRTDSVRENDARWNIGRLIARTWVFLLKKVCNAQHGGCFLVVPNDFIPSPGIVRIKYPVDNLELKRALIARAELEPDISMCLPDALATSSQPSFSSIPSDQLAHAHFRERDLARAVDMMAGLSSVDGAVLLSRDLKVLGFGTEILGTENPLRAKEVEFATHPSWTGIPKDVRPITRFGMRHRSAMRFCEQVPGSMAFVASQDGELRVFYMSDGKLVALEPAPEYRI